MKSIENFWFDYVVPVTLIFAVFAVVVAIIGYSLA